MVVWQKQYDNMKQRRVWTRILGDWVRVYTCKSFHVGAISRVQSVPSHPVSNTGASHVSWTNNSPNICHMSIHVMAGRDEETSSNPRVVTLETFNMYLATQDCVTLASATYHGPTSAAWSRVTVTCPPTWWPGVMTICWISATGRLNLFRVY